MYMIAFVIRMLETALDCDKSELMHCHAVEMLTCGKSKNSLWKNPPDRENTNLFTLKEDTNENGLLNCGVDNNYLGRI